MSYTYSDNSCDYDIIINFCIDLLVYGLNCQNTSRELDFWQVMHKVNSERKF